MNAPFFRQVPAWDMAKAKAFVAERALDAYQLIDVRQPNEFERGHLPGAKLIPLGDLPTRFDEISKDLPVLVYCRSGGRAGNATALLNQAGYDNAVNVGGIMQWEGVVASGAPEAGLAWFDSARSSEDYIALAWVLEEQARLFYLELAELFPAMAPLFGGLARGEESHKETLQRLYEELGNDGELGAPADLASDMMEGGIGRSHAMAWARQREVADVLDFAVAMEANAFDRYMRIGRSIGDPVQRVFVELAEEEKKHLDHLMEAFQRALS